MYMILTYMYVCTYVHVHAISRTCFCTKVVRHVCVRTCTYCIYVHTMFTYVRTYVHVCKHTQMHTYYFVHVRTYA